MDSKKAPLQDFKPLAQQSPATGLRRPSTAQATARNPRRMSFSRPLTSEGPQSHVAPAVPKVPLGSLQTQDISSDPGRIGVAVGSPTQRSTSTPIRSRAESAPRHPREDLARRLPRANTDTAIAPYVPDWDVKERPSLQSKPRGWRSVGELFKKRKAAPVHPLALQPRPEQKVAQTGSPSAPAKTAKPRRALPQQPTIVEEPEPPQWPTRGSSMRPRMRSRSVNKSKEEKPSCLQRTASKLGRAAKASGPAAGPWTDFQEQVRKRGSRPQLDVAIPETEFERYSIMFSELLRQSSGATASVNASTTDGDAAKHEPIASVDTIQSAQPSQVEKSVSDRDKPITNASEADQLRPLPKIDPPLHSPGLSTSSGTPKMSSYSLFPTVKPSPNPSVSSFHTPTATRSQAGDGIAVGPAVTPEPQLIASSPAVPRDHILSQHLDRAETVEGLGLHTGVGLPGSRGQDRPGPSPLSRIEPRELRSPDFSPDSPITRGSSVSSSWSDRPSIAHSHSRSKSSGQVVGSPGPSVSPEMESFHSARSDEERPPMPSAAPTHMPMMSRSASLRSHPLKAPGRSPQISYDDPSSPKVAVAQPIAARGTPQKMQMLPRTSSRKKRDDNPTLARLSESTSRAASPVIVDNSDQPDEETWLKRRSVWGVIEEGGRVSH
ncbi:MAG: hypothetical protein Q9162_003540 [Coniocarpon cinnabarinum]